MSVDFWQRLVVVYSVDFVVVEYEVQGNLVLVCWLVEVQKLEFGGCYEFELYQ